MEKFAIAFRRVLVNDPDSLFSETRIRIKYKLKRLENDYTQNESKKSETTDRRVKRMIENVRFSFSDRFLSFSLRALFGTKERTYVLLRLLLAHTHARESLYHTYYVRERSFRIFYNLGVSNNKNASKKGGFVCGLRGYHTRPVDII